MKVRSDRHWGILVSAPACLLRGSLTAVSTERNVLVGTSSSLAFSFSQPEAPRENLISWAPPSQYSESCMWGLVCPLCPLIPAVVGSQYVRLPALSTALHFLRKDSSLNKRESQGSFVLHIILRPRSLFQAPT